MTLNPGAIARRTAEHDGIPPCLVTSPTCSTPLLEWTFGDDTRDYMGLGARVVDEMRAENNAHHYADRGRTLNRVITARARAATTPVTDGVAYDGFHYYADCCQRLRVVDRRLAEHFRAYRAKHYVDIPGVGDGYMNVPSNATVIVGLLRTVATMSGLTHPDLTGYGHSTGLVFFVGPDSPNRDEHAANRNLPSDILHIGSLTWRVHHGDDGTTTSFTLGG